MTTDTSHADSKSFSFFTTEPKTRRHIHQSISGNRARDLLETMFRKGLWNVRYETLKYEAELYFETNDPRVIEKYIGRPSSRKRYPGSTVVRLNRQAGTLAKFDYMNDRFIEAKKGLMETLELITKEVNGRYQLHHELFAYSTQQKTLNPTPEVESIEDEQRSIDDLCVSSIGLSEDALASCLQRPATATRPNKETGEREREVIDSTHKSGVTKVDTLEYQSMGKNSGSTEDIAEKLPVLHSALTPEEEAIPHAPPSNGEPDRASVEYGKKLAKGACDILNGTSRRRGY